MRWCFGHDAANLGTTAQTQVASGYVRVLWQYPSALVLAVRDMLGKASRTLSGAADKNILVLQALPHSAPSRQISGKTLWATQNGSPTVGRADGISHRRRPRQEASSKASPSHRHRQDSRWAQ